MTDYFCRKWNWHRRWSSELMTYQTSTENGQTTTISKSERTCAICGVTITKNTERKDTITTSYPKEDE